MTYEAWQTDLCQENDKCKWEHRTGDQEKLPRGGYQRGLDRTRGPPAHSCPLPRYMLQGRQVRIHSLCTGNGQRPQSKRKVEDLEEELKLKVKPPQVGDQLVVRTLVTAWTHLGPTLRFRCKGSGVWLGHLGFWKLSTSVVLNLGCSLV